jgi:hypothetical protein
LTLSAPIKPALQQPFSVYGSRNIAWPWFIRYATDYSYGWPVWHVLHLYDYGQRIVFMSFLLNLLLTGTFLLIGTTFFLI